MVAVPRHAAPAAAVGGCRRRQLAVEKGAGVPAALSGLPMVAHFLVLPRVRHGSTETVEHALVAPTIHVHVRA